MVTRLTAVALQLRIVKLTDFTIFDPSCILLMKTKIFIAILFIIVIAGIIIYLLIPSPIIVSNSITFKTSSNGAYRTLINQDNWNRWSPQTFSVSKKLINTIELDFKNKNTAIPVSILLIPLSKDSVRISWKATFPEVANPVSKIKQYLQAVSTRNEMDETLKKFQTFVERNENIYGIHIQETSTSDTLLVATRFTSTTLPSSQLVYSNIDKLRAYTAAAGANISGPPMLNISTIDSTLFSCMVALPIDKIVDDNGPIFFVRMVPGRFLTTEVTGGPHTILFAHRMMDQYFKDFNRVFMAIPFEYLVTDRMKETDTTKWVTKVYGPVY